ncbi:MAG: hypothetical protein H6659_11910 [Ardenticatenaceae bacterium]|nr:hypothetical protein [Ardenticatenaceae bacterium]MCB8986177.1 hypothetical protein [Ardenticatenaceae bacterium]
MSEPKYIERPPRIQPELPQETVEIPPPPGEDQEPNQSLIQIGLPLLTIVGYVLIAMFGQGRSLLFILPMGVSVVASVAYALYSRHQSSQNKGVKEAAYAEQLLELRREMSVSHDMQRRFYRHNYPEPAVALAIAAEASSRFHHTAVSHENGHLANRLWERRTGDADFGEVRLGLGSLPSTVVYQLTQGGSFDDPQMRDAMRLAEDSQFVGEVPITIPLRQPAPDEAGDEAELIPRHSIGITGQDATAVYAFVRAVLAHYTVFQSPTDARLQVLGTVEARKNWRWVNSLPHTQRAQGGKPNETICFEDGRDREGDKERSKVYTFLKNLRNVLDERQLRLQDPDNNVDVTLPFLLVVVDMLADLPDDSALRDLEMDPGISLLLQEGPRLGAAILFLAPEIGKVPSGCRSIIEVTVAQDEADLNQTRPFRIGFRYAEVGVNTPRYIGQADFIDDQEALERLARQLEPLQVRKSYGADLPNGVLMMDMLGVSTAEELRQLTLENWRTNRQPDHADWLKVALGMLSGGDVRRLKFSADADGVHGLIAGSTGSGKSELLMTMILGLALNYDPTIVNFVLVDFKGGAAFEPFRTLPHCVDIVTNLRGSAVERMFAAITAELNRRQAINVATDSKHIVHYRQQKLHVPPYGRAVVIKDKEYHTAPYPHLFVFIDEFAEMIAENPEYKAQLNSITRLGRALGVTLILAAQRPTGVTDQMRANIKFRIALRVETREESSEVLRRPDAAYLPTGIPGRGYLQVGNENIEMLQVAWTGSEYRGGREKKKPNVIWHGRQKRAAEESVEELPKVFEMMVDMMEDLAKEQSLPQRTPWPDFLPTSMSLQTPIDATYINPAGLKLMQLPGVSPAPPESNGDTAVPGEDSLPPVPLNTAVSLWMNDENAWLGIDWAERAMRAIVGLVDNPYNSEQLPLVVDFRRGHAVIFGASGWGKTTFLRTLVASLAATHSPAELHVYILDFGGRQMSVLRDLPHVGQIITPDEEEKVTRLLRKLDQELNRRKTVLSDAGADDLYRYNFANPDAAIPAMLVAIDNFAEFRESFENLMPVLIGLVRESRAYGIHFVASAELPGSLGGKLYSLFTERMALKLSDPTEYSGIVGRGARAIDDIPGRGFIKHDRRALEFQTALPVGLPGEGRDLDETQKLLILVQAMQEFGRDIPKEKRPSPINTLANRVLLKSILPEPPVRTPAVRRRVQPILGIDDLTLEPWLFDMPGQGPHCLIIGPPSSGKTTTVRSLVLSLAHSYTPDEVLIVLADFQQKMFKYGGRRTLDELPHVVDVLAGADQLETFVANLEAECAAFADGRKRPIFVLIDNYDSFSEDAVQQRQILPALGTLAREYGTDGLHFVAAGSPGIARAPEELRKQLLVPRFGLALQTADTVQALNGRVPRGLAQADLPLGRGFAVRSGRTTMLQIATPYDDDEKIESILDHWVTAVCDRYPGQKNQWSSLAAPAEAVPAAPPKDGDTAVPATAVSEARPIITARPERSAVRTAVPENVDMAFVRHELKTKRAMSDTLLDMLSDVDMLNMAVEMKLITLPEEGE